MNEGEGEGDANSIMVFFIEEPKVGVKAIKEVATQMRNEGGNVNRSIIVIQDKITPFAKQSAERNAAEDYDRGVSGRQSSW
jgi:hypothetical protein